MIMGVEKQPAIMLSSLFGLFTFLFPNLGNFWSAVVVWESFVLSWDQINLIFYGAELMQVQISVWDPSWSSLWINRAATDVSHTSWSKLLQVTHSAVAQDCCSKFLENLALAEVKQPFDNAME